MTTDPCAAVADPSHPIPPRRLHQLPAPLQQWLVGAIEIGVRRSCEFHDELADAPEGETLVRQPDEEAERDVIVTKGSSVIGSLRATSW
jgi:hypothetical protein